MNSRRIRNPVTRSAIGCICAMVISQSAFGDVFEMKDGRRLVGKFITERQEQKQIVIELDSGVKMLLDQKEIKQRIKPYNAEGEYEKRLAQMEDSVAGNLEMARWCEKSGLMALKYAHFERVIDLDPDNAPARAALGYRSERGQWLRVETVMGEKRGKVLFKGKWEFPEVVEIEKRQAESKKAFDTLRKDIKQWTDDIVLNRRQAADSRAKLEALTDPVAVSVFSGMIFPPNDVQKMVKNAPSEVVLQMYVRIIAKIGTPDAVNLLVKITMTEGENEAAEAARRETRELCYQLLKSIAPKEAARLYVNYLKDPKKSPRTIDMAGRGLAYMLEESTLLVLIENLVTSHTIVVQGSGPTNAGFGGDGSFSFGNTPNRQVETKHESEPILAALNGITKQSFGYDKGKWLQWYAAKRFGNARDLRRDP